MEMEKVLVIEDNPDNFRLVNYPLKRAGYMPEWAKDGLDGLKMALANKYQFVLLDIGLPDVNGLEVARKIREVDMDVPIIALTSYAMAGDREKAIDAGCNGYVEKPIDTESIITTIEAIVGAK